MTDEEKKETAQPPRVDLPGYPKDEPRVIDHMFEFDRRYREWSSLSDSSGILQKGRALIADLMRWIPSHRRGEADEIFETIKKNTIKTRVERGEEDYLITYDSVPMYLAPRDLPAGLEHIRAEALDVKADAQAETIALLLRICDEEGITKRDYEVGDDADRKMDREVEQY